MAIKYSSRILTSHWRGCAALALALGAGAALAPAGSAKAQTFQDWMNQKTMTGDWNGGRTKLENEGISFNVGYVGEFADVMSGGERQGNGYAQQLAYGVKVDLGKLAGLDGTVLNIGFNTRQGRSVSSDFIGNKLSVQEVYGAGETTRVTELSIEQAMLNKTLMLKGGFYPMGDDFAHMAMGCTFQNVGFCSHAQNLPNSSGWADNPQGRLGGRAKYFPIPNLYIEAGVYDSNPTYGEHGNGLKVGTSGSTGALIPVEAGYTIMPDTLPGIYTVGGYYDTSQVADVTNPHEIDDGRYGFYAIANQMLISFDGSNKRGLNFLAMVSYSDPGTALFQGSVVGGLIATGPFASRPTDFINVGYVRAIINQRAVKVKETEDELTDLSAGEGVVEFGYGFQATPWLLLHPNIQYVMNPDTFSYKTTVPNAWVFGLQTSVTF